MLPQRAGFLSVERGDGIACSTAVQHGCPFQRLRQCIVAEQQKVSGRFGIVKEIERQTAGFGIPEGMAIVCFTGQPFGTDIVAHAASVIGLRQLEAAEADPLLLCCHNCCVCVC